MAFDNFSWYGRIMFDVWREMALKVSNFFVVAPKFGLFRRVFKEDGRALNVTDLFSHHRLEKGMLLGDGASVLLVPVGHIGSVEIYNRSTRHLSGNESVVQERVALQIDVLANSAGLLNVLGLVKLKASKDGLFEVNDVGKRNSLTKDDPSLLALGHADIFACHRRHGR